MISSQPTKPVQQETKLLPFEFAQEHGVLWDGKDLLCRQQPVLAVLLELRRVLGPGLNWQLIDQAEFQVSLTRLYQSGADAAQRAAEELGDDFDLDALVDEIPQHSDLLSGADNAPVIRLINALLSQAVREKASDIHIEPFERRVSVRFRVDGVLRDVLSPKAELGPVLVSRLKVMARLDIAEKRLPQDGRISVRLAGHAVDIRMSTIPSSFGERVVLRLLDQAAGQLQLDHLDLPPAMQAALQSALQKPHGIILVTGPTGSGKTTTLYAGLQHINSRERNILTIEDPVEYQLAGIGQTQVNTKVDMTFARGLRAILRQDPDVVMVGEIRDQETAAIAVQASLTGHLVLSTLHTNTAVGAVTRLQDMGIEPFLLASSLTLIVAQRLVRSLCPACRLPHQVDGAESARLQLPPDSIVFRAVGCEHCNHTGYKGRSGLYEIVEIDSPMRRLIHDGAAEQALEQYARQHSSSIHQHGRERILAGQTSVEEVLRVTSLSEGAL
ncbi:MAG: type II secretion system ATPase GspE [Pseudohongiella sp.]|nr:type II secretion system ATPase GspE [Pseudohongiella sp.]MDP2126972.1 type II secretion system ATPase GspE [Pseudohongiella sp.]